MIILSLHRRIHRPSHTPQMYLYRLVLLSYKGLFYKRFGEGGLTNSDGVSGMTEAYLFMRLLPRVLPSIQRAKALRTQIPDILLRNDTQALHLTARIPLIQRREKCPSREEKSAFT